jgi:putative aldouronate transport system permease protein
VKEAATDRVGHGVVVGILFLLSIATLYPFWHMLMYSISDPNMAMGGGIFLWPKGFSLTAYELLLQSHGIFNAYFNSILRLVLGTMINVIFTALLAYPLSIRRFVGRNFITLMIFFTMIFGGGMIPTFLLVKELGLLDSIWALIIPGAISAWNLIIMKNFFQSIPPELEESASMDGATPTRMLFSIVLPISMPVIAAVALFYGVHHWNAYFDAILYINTQDKQVLQVFIRIMLNSSSLNQLSGIQEMEALSGVTEESIKMATIVVSVLPMLLFYPFLQKYYVKGVMIGSIKG